MSPIYLQTVYSILFQRGKAGLVWLVKEPCHTYMAKAPVLDTGCIAQF